MSIHTENRGILEVVLTAQKFKSTEHLFLNVIAGPGIKLVEDDRVGMSFINSCMLPDTSQSSVLLSASQSFLIIEDMESLSRSTDSPSIMTLFTFFFVTRS